MNNHPMNLSPRCLARTRRGTLCQSPSVRGRKRCRIHGGAKGSGAPKGNRNAFKDGYYCAEEVKKRRETRQLIKNTRAFLRSIKF